ncbi:CaiF/GrlA family transcriptional regulator [Salmonella enterica subsp. enterica]|nr:CaiF/GrlA family transcriptional regulator [Salmonella enterica subsp. enterica serovar Mokola]EDT7664191.1 CaiF/GrlA family transcriptional regulator [Salmonella enterica subsp. enterica serovar Waycross]EIC6029879.1 CaiF/GrlA family transcriptional regulator [Salmonella enterica subsp. enterica serovar Corvallis]HDA4097857.1 CaiF/GrlA family transcriptional regulator [Salmonella enterica subsp. enterica serovar Mokola]HDA4107513.1 CaiF/GrlA family transcriptional regulator [Salmonella ente
MCSDRKNVKKENKKDNKKHYPTQRNHDTCFIPDSVSQYTGEPLHIIVAYWCIQQGGWVRRKQISEAFRITERRASYLMEYIRNKARRVVCEYRASVVSNKVFRYEIFITGVTERPVPGKVQVNKKSSRCRRSDTDTAWLNVVWNQFCRGRIEKDDEQS